MVPQLRRSLVILPLLVFPALAADSALDGFVAAALRGGGFRRRLAGTCPDGSPCNVDSDCYMCSKNGQSCTSDEDCNGPNNNCVTDVTCNTGGTGGGGVCGDDALDAGEECDGTADSACNCLGCRADCTCYGPSPPIGVDLEMTGLERVNCPKNCGQATAGEEVLLSGFIYSRGADDPDVSYKMTFHLSSDGQTCDPDSDLTTDVLGSSTGPASFNCNSNGEKYFGMGGGSQFFLPVGSDSIPAGVYYWCAIIDVDEVITETDESNNVAFSTGTVRIR